ncbi:hypothetical protein D3C77_775720 [compost metagenome]
MKVLRGIEFNGAVPVARSPSHARLFTEAGDAQFQRVTEAVDTQLPGVLERLS